MPDLADLVRPQKVVGLLLIGPRLAIAGLRLTESTVRGVVGLIDRREEETVAEPDSDHLWTPPDEGAQQNGAGDLDAAASAPEAPPEARREPEPEGDEPPAPSPTAREEQPGEAALPPLDPAAGHVSEDVTLVAEVADSGAEEGAGAELRVDEPWSGYAAMTAQDVVERLAVEPVEVSAVVELYERAHRGRQSVLEAAEREVRRRSGPGASS